MTKVVIYTLYSVICRPVPKQRYLQCGIYKQGPMPKLVIYTARLSTHYFTLQTNQNGHMAAFLDAGVPCLSVLPETCLPIPIWLQLPLTSFLGGAPSGCQSPPLALVPQAARAWRSLEML